MITITYRHIIAPLVIMAIQSPSLGVLGHNAIQRIRHVGPHIRVVVFVERQRARRVLDEEGQEADFVVSDLRQLLGDVVGDEVRATAARRERKRLLEPGRATSVVLHLARWRTSAVPLPTTTW